MADSVRKKELLGNFHLRASGKKEGIIKWTELFPRALFFDSFLTDTENIERVRE